MKKGISLYFGFEYNNKQRYTDIKNAGFEYYMANPDERFDEQNGTFEEQMQIVKELSLKQDSLHCRYISKNLPYFWIEGDFGEKLLNGYLEDLRTAKKYGFKQVVFHFLGEPSHVGLQRMRELLALAEELDVFVAVENLPDNYNIFTFIFDNLESDHLKFCYDIGHENVAKEFTGILDKYLDKLVCLHLHSNNGEWDMHTLNKYGNVNWDKFAQVLARKTDVENLVLNYELLLHYKGEETDAKAVLAECYQQACELEQLINKYRKVK